MERHGEKKKYISCHIGANQTVAFSDDELVCFRDLAVKKQGMTSAILALSFRNGILLRHPPIASAYHHSLLLGARKNIHIKLNESSITIIDVKDLL